jgi:mono/diheme cytochrome c family protein
MRQSFLVLGVLLFACQVLSASTRRKPQEEDKPADHKITAADIARTNPVKPTPEGLAQARRVFGYDCAMCHGAQGDGKGDLVESMKLNVRDLRDPATLVGKTDGELFAVITKGKGKMMGEGDRQPEQIRWELVNFVRSLSAKSVTQKPPTAQPSS